MDATPNAPKDHRLQAAEDKLNRIENHLVQLQQRLDSVPTDCRDDVRRALREAAVIGALLNDVQRHEQPHPVDPEGNLLLGRAMKRHLQQVRNLHSRADDAENTLRTTLNDTGDEPRTAA